MRYTFIIFFLGLAVFSAEYISAQQVEVQANYNSVGDVDFIAYNNSKAPLFLNIDFADLENTTFNEPLPYVKLLEPGFNNLFTLQRYPDAEVPRFNYQIKYFRSNPMAKIDLDFPYLFPFAPGSTVQSFNVENINGFAGTSEPRGWLATGFEVIAGQAIYAARNGIVVEITGGTRSTEPETWYNGWKNSITLLQSDGTLICYRNVVDPKKKLKVGQKVYAGQEIGEIVTGASQLIVLVYHDSLNSKDKLFIIPQFVTAENEIELVSPSKKYRVIHPKEIMGMEMTNKEKRKLLK